MNKFIIEGIKLVSWQKDFVKEFLSLQPEDKLVCKSHRQVGKSLTLGQILIYIAINRPKSVSYYISPTNKTNNKAFLDLKDSIEGSPLISKCNGSDLFIEFTNKSRIYYLSAESSSLRGNTVKNGGCLLIDEAAFISDDVISVLLPYVNVSKGNIIAVSTPRRRAGMWADWITLAEAGTPGYHYLDVCNYDTSFFLSESQKEDYRRIMSPEKYKNEILGQFSNADEGVFGDYKKSFRQPDDMTPVYCGVDWSTDGTDDTVLTALNSKGEMCVLQTFNQKEPMQRAAAIGNFINQHPSIKRVVCENNSIGSVYISALRGFVNSSQKIVEFNTNNTSKRRVVDQLVAAVGSEEITLLPDKKLDYQLGIFICVPTANGGITYYADPKVSNSHDDTVLSLCFAVEAYKTSTKQGKYFIY